MLLTGRKVGDNAVMSVWHVDISAVRHRRVLSAGLFHTSSLSMHLFHVCPVLLLLLSLSGKCQTPLHGHRLRTQATNTTNGHHQRTSSQQFYNLLYNKFTTIGQKFATSQHLDMSRCWALLLRCGKFVVELL